MAVANEFFDALPLHQFEAVGGEWREKLIDAGDGEPVRGRRPSHTFLDAHRPLGSRMAPF